MSVNVNRFPLPTLIFCGSKAEAVSRQGLGQTQVSGLKICFWETGVPVRVRPRPPPRKYRAMDWQMRVLEARNNCEIHAAFAAFAPERPHRSHSPIAIV
jgi:hypothetical protein